MLKSLATISPFLNFRFSLATIFRWQPNSTERGKKRISLPQNALKIENPEIVGNSSIMFDLKVIISMDMETKTIIESMFQ